MSENVSFLLFCWSEFCIDHLIDVGCLASGCWGLGQHFRLGFWVAASGDRPASGCLEILGAEDVLCRTIQLCQVSAVSKGIVKNFS